MGRCDWANEPMRPIVWADATGRMSRCGLLNRLMQPDELSDATASVGRCERVRERNYSANPFEESPNGEKSYKSVQIIQIIC